MKADIDIQRLCGKASIITEVEHPIDLHRKTIQKLNKTRQTRLQHIQKQMIQNEIDESAIDNSIYVQGHSIAKSTKRSHVAKINNCGDSENIISSSKNPDVGDIDKMVFDKKFKNYLNHKQVFQMKARRRRQAILEKKKKIKQGTQQPIDDYYDANQILSNTGSDYQYKNADDMQAAYDTLATGKRRKKGVQLFYGEQFQFTFRLQQFGSLLSVMPEPEKALIFKDLLLNYLFQEPMVMMLYSINPYALGDEISEFETQTPSMLCFQEFSAFLLEDREPTYFAYTEEHLDEARKIGRGLKCAPIVGKWIDETGIYEQLMDIFDSVDMFGNGTVESAVLAKKLMLYAQRTRILDVQVIEIVNINKLVPLNRILYQIEHQTSDQYRTWTKQAFTNYLENYHRLGTPDKDKLVTKLIMAGKYDTSYIYVVSQEVLDFLKSIFDEMEKFAQFFVKKNKFIEKVTKHKKYQKLRQFFVRSQTNRYVVKQNVEEALIRLYSEADSYIDIQELLDFFTNRGRPRLVEYKVYITNLERQLAIIQAEDQAKRKKAEELGQDEISTSSDEQFEKQLKKKKLLRKRQKLKDIQNSNKFNNNKKFNVTIPIPYAFDQRDKHKKVSIRQRKVKQMVEAKRKEEQQMCKPIPVKEVPKHVKTNLYQKIMKDQERQRLERLERFRLEIKQSMVPMSDRLTKPKTLDIHCDFSREQYEFVARPMPWYCQVNLLDRINRKKQERRQRILEQIINKHHDNDLPEGVIRMLERHENLQQKRKQKKIQAQTADGSTRGGQCTFIPKITHSVPDFEAIHQNLGIDLQIAREKNKPVFPEPFSFETREHRSRTHNCYTIKQKTLNYSRQLNTNTTKPQIKITQKYKALVEKRKQERQANKFEQEQQMRKQQVRKLRQQKFAPQVRRVLKQNDRIMGRSRNQLQSKIKQFEREQKRQKRVNEQLMINMYAKVWNRPLLIQTGQFGEQEINKNSRYDQIMKEIGSDVVEHTENYGAYGGSNTKQAQKRVQGSKNSAGVRKRGAKKNKQQGSLREKEKRQHEDYDEKRRKAIQQAPGQYLMEDDNMEYAGDGQEYNEQDFARMINQGLIDPNDPNFQQYAAQFMQRNADNYDDEFDEEDDAYLQNNGMKTQ